MIANLPEWCAGDSYPLADNTGTFFSSRRTTSASAGLSSLLSAPRRRPTPTGTAYNDYLQVLSARKLQIWEYVTPVTPFFGGSLWSCAGPLPLGGRGLPSHGARQRRFPQQEEDVKGGNMADDNSFTDSCRFEHPNGGGYRNNQSSGRFPAANAGQRKFQDAIGLLSPRSLLGAQFLRQVLTWAES